MDKLKIITQAQCDAILAAMLELNVPVKTYKAAKDLFDALPGHEERAKEEEDDRG